MILETVYLVLVYFLGAVALAAAAVFIFAAVLVLIDVLARVAAGLDVALYPKKGGRR